MISNLSIKNFKCFNHLSLNLADLTLLTGFNSGGKSSSLQPLLLLSQALRRGPNLPSLALNGPRVSLGEASDILNWNSPEDSIYLKLEDEAEEISWKFRYHRDKSRRGMVLNELNWKNLKRTNKSTRQIWPLNATESKLIRSIRDVIYISALRKEHWIDFPLPSEAYLPRADVGVLGEFAPYWYSELADEEIDSLRLHSSESSKTVRSQMDAWVGELFPETNVNAYRNRDSASSILQFKTSRFSDWSKPTNVGHGLTYVFPILVSLLTAKPGTILIIDSPEAHLHPRAQSSLGKLLTVVANSGVQILVESHSDHLLSGIRLGVKSRKISHQNVRLYFFGRNEAEDQSGNNVRAPSINSAGQIDDWPDGFFDQAEQDLTILSGWLD